MTSALPLLFKTCRPDVVTSGYVCRQQGNSSRSARAATHRAASSMSQDTPHQPPHHLAHCWSNTKASALFSQAGHIPCSCCGTIAEHSSGALLWITHTFTHTEVEECEAYEQAHKPLCSNRRLCWLPAGHSRHNSVHVAPVPRSVRARCVWCT